jgi:hypothetical protein
VAPSSVAVTFVTPVLPTAHGEDNTAMAATVDDDADDEPNGERRPSVRKPRRA